MGMNVIHSMVGHNAVSMYADPSAIAAAESAKARIQSAYIMALQKPRNYDHSRLKILAACKRPAFAEKVEYEKPVGGNNSISGPSIRFAELALREWGNIAYENQVVFDDEHVRRIRVTVIDLESNTTFSKEAQLNKTIERKSNKGREVVGERLNSYGETVYIVKATEDEIQTKEAALISKALRNEGLRLIPTEIIEEAIALARKTMESADKQDLDAARKRLTGAFFEHGVKPTDLEKFLGHPLDQCQPDELQELRGIFRAIKDGEAKWSSFIEKKEEEQTKGQRNTMMDQIMNATPPGNGKASKAQTAKAQPTVEPEPYSASLAPINPDMLPFGAEPPVELVTGEGR